MNTTAASPIGARTFSIVGTVAAVPIEATHTNHPRIFAGGVEGVFPADDKAIAAVHIAVAVARRSEEQRPAGADGGRGQFKRQHRP